MAVIRYSFVYRDGAPDGAPVRCFYWCDTMADITYIPEEGDLAFAQDTLELYVCAGGVWQDIYTSIYPPPPFVGPMGPPGMDGFDGEPGIDGINGRDGTVGTPGTPGSIGPPGLQGPPGLDGFDGLDGMDGSPGPRGPAGPAGGGGGSLSSTIVTLPYSSKQHSINVVDALVTAISKIMITLGTNLDTDVNGDDVELLALSTVPAAGSFLVKLNFLTPVGGPLTLHYMVG